MVLQNSKPRKEVWRDRFLDLADSIGQFSKDSTKVGCVIVDGKHRIVASGYNGLPRGIPSDCEQEILDNKDFRDQLVVHAEVNAVLNATTSIEGCSVFITRAPCPRCAAVLIQMGVREVIYRDDEDSLVKHRARVLLSLYAFKKANIKILEVLK